MLDSGCLFCSFLDKRPLPSGFSAQYDRQDEIGMTSYDTESPQRGAFTSVWVISDYGNVIMMNNETNLLPFLLQELH